MAKSSQIKLVELNSTSKFIISRYATIPSHVLNHHQIEVAGVFLVAKATLELAGHGH